MKPRVFLIGGFKKTRFLANSLIKKGYSVTAINDDNEKCLELAEIEKLTVFNGDGSKPFVLEDANIYNADIAIALTDKDTDNLVISELCKKKYGVKRTVALIADPKKTDFFYHMGIDSVVCAASMVASSLEEQAFRDEMSTMLTVGGKRIKVSQVHIPDTSPAVDKTLRVIDLPERVIVACIIRDDESIIARGNTQVKADDVLLMVTSDEDEPAAIRELTGR
jgi:trk system potassium uptake protein TrkA